MERSQCKDQTQQMCVHCQYVIFLRALNDGNRKKRTSITSKLSLPNIDECTFSFMVLHAHLFASSLCQISVILHDFGMLEAK